ncbi:MAG TPA: Ppx/GppA phosphatase family protein [Oscillospiraceae bacterium]|nr:Ppx/GppA phosphatase family protein [Oscillospiraceae bacterium]
MKKHAAIDIGTNSMRLLLATTENGKIIQHKKYTNTTRIGAFVDKNKIISREGIGKNTKAFCDFVEKAKKYGAEKISAIATSAVREAKNRGEFIQTIYLKTGINIKIISGEEEAELGYMGVIMGMQGESKFHCPESLLLCHPEMGSKGLTCKESDLPCPSSLSKGEFIRRDSLLVIDIGGGSTELILGKGNTLQKTISLDIGAVRMTERFITTDPVNKEEHEKMEETICEIIKRHSDTDSTCPHCPSSPLTAVGIGGTITTLAALHQKLDPYDPEKIHNYKLTLGDINNLKEKLLSLTTKQIKQLKGIHPKRADIIIAGITILSIIMDILNLKEITISEYDNLEGLLY